jgi:hypothetical protein
MSEKEQKVFTPFDGLPTGPDVSALQKQWPELAAGDRIPYEDVEALLGMAWNTPRFKTITNAWRARELERARVILCEPGVAFVVATADQISERTYGVLRHVGRQAKQQRHRLSTVRPVSEIQKQTVEHQARLMLAMEREAKKSRMNLLPKTEQKETVRIQPPKQAAQ